MLFLKIFHYSALVLESGVLVPRDFYYSITTAILPHQVWLLLLYFLLVILSVVFYILSYFEVLFKDKKISFYTLLSTEVVSLVIITITVLLVTNNHTYNKPK